MATNDSVRVEVESTRLGAPRGSSRVSREGLRATPTLRQSDARTRFSIPFNGRAISSRFDRDALRYAAKNRSAKRRRRKRMMVQSRASVHLTSEPHPLAVHHCADPSVLRVAATIRTESEQTSRR